jgi:hypothetical protein
MSAVVGLSSSSEGMITTLPIFKHSIGSGLACYSPKSFSPKATPIPPPITIQEPTVFILTPCFVFDIGLLLATICLFLGKVWLITLHLSFLCAWSKQDATWENQQLYFFTQQLLTFLGRRIQSSENNTKDFFCSRRVHIFINADFCLEFLGFTNPVKVTSMSQNKS